MWWLWLLLANGAIFYVEHTYRLGKHESFFHAFPEIVFPIMVAQIGLFYGFRYAPSLFFAGALFTLLNVALRVVNTFRLGEHLNVYNWVGVLLLIVATVLLKIK